MIKKLISYLFSIIGYKLIRTGREKERLECEFTQEGALFRASKMNLDIKSAIDIGASDGRWSRICMKYFHHPHYLLIEAQCEHEEMLKKFCSRNNNAEFIIAAAGDVEGNLNFDTTSLFGGLASHTPFEEHNRVVAARKIDNIISERKIKPPYLLKLDTHGFEIPILEGAAETLKETNLLIIEAYNFLVADNSVRFFNLCRYLEEKGFLPIDIADLTRRKLDNSFWQMDIYFIPKNHPVFSKNSYS